MGASVDGGGEEPSGAKDTIVPDEPPQKKE